MDSELVRNGLLDRQAAADALQALLTGLIANAALELTIKVHAADGSVLEGEPEVFGEFQGKDSELLLARNAELLRSIEYLALRMLRIDPSLHERFHLDCAGYRALRFEELRMSARIAAERVVQTRQPFRMNPMSSRERRIVHLALKEFPNVRSESVGAGDERQVVIHPVAPPPKLPR